MNGKIKHTRELIAYYDGDDFVSASPAEWPRPDNCSGILFIEKETGKKYFYTKDFEQERDEAAIKDGNYESFQDGADWSRDRFEKIIAEKDAHINRAVFEADKARADRDNAENRALDIYRKKLADRDAMIEKLAAALDDLVHMQKLKADRAIGDLQYHQIRPGSWRRATAVLSELDEWKKTL